MSGNSTSFGPASRRVLADDVTDQLRDAIVTGALAPDARLREDDLAVQMQVSRGPVREAFVKLEREGLVVIERYRGARVAKLYRGDIEQIFSLRKALEMLAAEWACKNATEDDLAALTAAIDRYAAAVAEERTPELIAEVDIAFHDALIAAAHHERLLRAWENLRSQIFSFLVTRMALRKDYDGEWETDHRQIMELVRQGDSEAAVARIQGHISASYTRVVAAMDGRE